MEKDHSTYNSNNTLLDELMGSSYQGGLIFFLDVDDSYGGLEGIVAAPSDYSGNHPWGCWEQDLLAIPNNYLTTSPSGAGWDIGYGENNTNAIVAEGCKINNNTNVAGRLAAGYTSGNYSDWYLPSGGEMEQMLQHKRKLGINGFIYWTSSEWDDSDAWMFFKESETKDIREKWQAFELRFVRQF